jgi:hypothetical protein
METKSRDDTDDMEDNHSLKYTTGLGSEGYVFIYIKK